MADPNLERRNVPRVPEERKTATLLSIRVEVAARLRQIPQARSTGWIHAAIPEWTVNFNVSPRDRIWKEWTKKPCV
jgi:hypothetical protein